ncbi:hypothetical protein ACWD5R_39060 [Streptomyces sp. NPDC002514]|uniref:hypothetical protein n=1 Tax=unclassified Streptomyces TaxID=2593676 RepID=UPI0036AEB671
MDFTEALRRVRGIQEILREAGLTFEQRFLLFALLRGTVVDHTWYTMFALTSCLIQELEDYAERDDELAPEPCQPALDLMALIRSWPAEHAEAVVRAFAAVKSACPPNCVRCRGPHQARKFS